MNTPIQCPCGIKDIYDAWETARKEKVEEARVYLVPVSEIVGGGYLKVFRSRDKALAPERVRNRTDEDVRKGQEKYDRIEASILKDGFDPLRPLSFLIRRKNDKRRLHQGHHRVAIAHEIGIDQVPVIFLFDRSRST